MKRIAILETGHNSEALADRFGRFGDAFRRWLAVHRGEYPLEIGVYHVEAHEFPARADAYDGYIVTGSAASVYEAHPWLTPTTDFLRAALGLQRRIVGVCFGHQLLAHALGGRVEKSAKGWGIGRHTYAVNARAPWMDPPLAEVSLIACHQDQVVELPPGAQVLASSSFCEFAMLAVGENVITVQAHPEFSPEYAASLYETRRDRIGAEMTGQGLASLAEPTHADDFARWVLEFFFRP